MIISYREGHRIPDWFGLGSSSIPASPNPVQPGLEVLPGQRNPPTNIPHPAGAAEPGYGKNAHSSQYIGNKIEMDLL